MIEADIEEIFRKKVKQKGGLTYKWVSPGNSGVPDRIVVWPGGIVDFVELKRKSEKPTSLQLRQHDRLRRLGQRVFILTGLEEVLDYLKED